MHFIRASILCVTTFSFVGGCNHGSATDGGVAPRDASGKSSVPDWSDSALDQLCRSPTKAVVLIFTRCECPIANRYAPEIRRICEEFTPRGVAFQLIYPEPGDSPAAIGEHLKAFGYTCPAWRDPEHLAVKRFGPKVTPEAVVFDCATKKPVYRGRIDDLYVDFGQARQAPTTHDLRDALAAVLAGKRVLVSSTNSVGCAISE